jgi:succinylglutamate desuccinylase
VLAVRQEVQRFFRKKMDGASAACVRGYTMKGNLFALFQAESEGITWSLDLYCSWPFVSMKMINLFLQGLM